jgi:hypothetical protein
MGFFASLMRWSIAANVFFEGSLRDPACMSSHVRSGIGAPKEGFAP